MAYIYLYILIITTKNLKQISNFVEIKHNFLGAQKKVNAISADFQSHVVISNLYQN